uniref:Beta-defensin-like domain-containing protein n=1 Tax=Pavo cristatus TaxID=9049 RepID=A0A8C9G335_PAVCR
MWGNTAFPDPIPPGCTLFLVEFLLPCCTLRNHCQPCENPGQEQTMRIVYLLLPFILLLAQGAAGSSRALGRADCLRRNGFCTFLKCPSLTIISGTCSRFQLCCKKIWG